MTIEKKVEEYLEHYNHNHDALGRFTFSNAIGSVVSSVRSSRAKRLEERTKRDKEKLAYQKIKNKAKQARAKLKAEKMVSKSKEKLIRAKAKAKAAEYLKKAKIEKGSTKAEKEFDKNLDIAGKTAAERNANREQLRKDKAAEIKEAIESGSVAKLAKYKDLMTTNEINTAASRIEANNKVNSLQTNKITSLVGKAETAINTVDRVMQAKNKVDKWISDSETAEKKRTEAEKKAERQKMVLDLYRKATEGDKSAVDKLEDIAAELDTNQDDINNVIQRAKRRKKEKEEAKHSALAHYNHYHDSLGRFASGPNSSGRFSTGGKTPKKNINMKVEGREKHSSSGRFPTGEKKSKINYDTYMNMKVGNRERERRKIAFGKDSPMIGFGYNQQGSKPSKQQRDTFTQIVENSNKIDSDLRKQAIDNLYEPYIKYGFGEKTKSEFAKGVRLDEICIEDKKADYDPDFPDPYDIKQYDVNFWYTHPEYGDWVIEYDSKKKKIYNQEFFR